MEKSCSHCIGPREMGGRKPGHLPTLCFSWGGVLVGWCLEQNQPNETLSPDSEEVAMSRRLGPEVGRLGPEVGILSLKDSSKPTCRGHPGQRGCSVHRSKTSCDASGVLDA